MRKIQVFCLLAATALLFTGAASSDKLAIQEKIDEEAAIRIAERFLDRLQMGYSSGASVRKSPRQVEGLYYYTVSVPSPAEPFRVQVDDEGRLMQFSNPGASTALSERTEPGEKSIRDKDALRARAVAIAQTVFPTEKLRVHDHGFSSGHHGFKEDTAELRSLTEQGSFKILVEQDGHIWRDRTYGIMGNVSAYDGTLLYAYIRQWAPPHDKPVQKLDEEGARNALRNHFPKFGDQFLLVPLHLGYILPNGRQSGRLAWCWNSGPSGVQGIDAENGDYLFVDYDLKK